MYAKEDFLGFFFLITFNLLAGSIVSHSLELSASEINDLLEESLLLSEYPLPIRLWVDCLPDLSLDHPDGMFKLLSIIDLLLKIAHITYIFSELGVA